eukprot:scaffold68038_cov18-Tisochrysis_lutea.AAC.1
MLRCPLPLPQTMTWGGARTIARPAGSPTTECPTTHLLLRGMGIGRARERVARATHMTATTSMMTSCECGNHMFRAEALT